MRVFFLSRKYCRAEAWCNRLLAYAKYFKKYSADVTLLFLVNNEQSEFAGDDFYGIDTKFISRFSDNDNKLKKTIIYISALISAMRMFSKGDIIITSDGGGLFLPLLRIIGKRCFTFAEITEHPDVFGRGINVVGFRGHVKAFFHSLQVHRDNLMLRKITGIFTITSGLKNYYLDKGISPQKICQVNMFVDSERFEIQKQTVEPYVAYCGTLSFGKDGIDVLIRAFSIFSQTFPSYKLYLIGPYMNDIIRRETESLINSLMLKDKVVLTGKVIPQQMPSLLKNAKILALSRPDNIQNRYGFPTKLGEYLATGNPVVVTNIGEIPNYLSDGVNAYFANPNDINSFAESLCRAASDVNFEQVGLKGEILSRTVFSASIQTKEAFDFIKSHIQ